jgi:hypothetical protein
MAGDLPRRGRKRLRLAAVIALTMLFPAALIAFFVLVVAPSVSAAGGCGGG